MKTNASTRLSNSLSDVVGCVSGSSDNTVVVKTSLGDIRGRVVSAPLNDMTGITVDQYLGIPFAVPPVGQLRYADPVPLDRLPSGELGDRESIRGTAGHSEHRSKGVVGWVRAGVPPSCRAATGSVGVASGSVALLRLVSPGAETDGVTPMSSPQKNWRPFLFSHHFKMMTFFSCRLVTTPQLPSSDTVLSSVLCKFSHTFSFGCHPPGWYHPGWSAPPLPQ